MIRDIDLPIVVSTAREKKIIAHAALFDRTYELPELEVEGEFEGDLNKRSEEAHMALAATGCARVGAGLFTPRRWTQSEGARSHQITLRGQTSSRRRWK